MASDTKRKASSVTRPQVVAELRDSGATLLRRSKHDIYLLPDGTTVAVPLRGHGKSTSLSPRVVSVIRKRITSAIVSPS